MTRLNKVRQIGTVPLPYATTLGIEHGGSDSTLNRDLAIQLADIVFLVDEQCAIDWVSPSIEASCGWRLDELVGQQWQTVMHPADLDTARESVRGRTENRVRLEMRVRSKGGGYRWFKACVSALESPTGRRFLVGLDDIHDEVVSRQQRQWSEVWLRRLFDEIPDPVSEWTPIFNECNRVVDLKAVRTNRTFDAGFGGYSVEGRLASAFAAHIIDMIPTVEQLLREGRDIITQASRGQQHFHLHLSLTPRASVMVVARELLRDTNAIDQQQLRERERHLARMAHTLRTNLSVVQGWTELLTDASDETDAEKIRDAVAGIARSAQQALVTVSSLLDAAKSEQGNYLLELRALDLPTMVKAVIADVPQDIAQRLINTSIEDGLRVFAHADALITVLHHLIENAIRFAKSTVSVTGRRSGNVIEIRVLDDGPGIADDVELFAPFTPHHHGDGHGLGLNVVSTLVDAMHGSITGQNRDDAMGAEFVLRLTPAGDDYADSSSR